jgi:GTPase Era involved in 16S rRNA processing
MYSASVEKKAKKRNSHQFVESSTTASTTSASTNTAMPATHKDIDESYQQKQKELLEGINMRKLAQFISNCEKAVEPGKDKDLILLIGKTGAGKSTLLNYLMGCKLEKIKNGMQTCLNVVGTKFYAEIGHALTESKTLYPQVVPLLEEPQCAYVDLPGIGDSRSLEEKLCAGMALPMTLSVASSVKGIILVIDARDLTSGRCEIFVDSLKILGSLFKKCASDLSEISNQMVIAFTKLEENCTLQDILKTVKNIEIELLSKKEKCQMELNKITELLAISVNLENEWKHVYTNKESLENKINMRMKIFEIASQKKIGKNSNLINNVERFEIAYKQLQEINSQLLALVSIFEYSNTGENLFIIHGNEQDNKLELLRSLAKFKNMRSIPKYHFNLNDNQYSEYNILNTIIQAVATKGAALLSQQIDNDEEIPTLKRYQKLVEKQCMNDEGVLQTLKNTWWVSNQDLDKFQQEIVDSQKEILNYLHMAKQKKKSKKEALENELKKLDTTEGTRYMHKSLDPVKFEYGVPKTIFDFSIRAITYPPSAILTFVGFTVSSVGVLLESIIERTLQDLKEMDLIDISSKTKCNIASIPLIPGALVLAPMKLMIGMNFHFHRFKYEGIPYIYASGKSDLKEINPYFSDDKGPIDSLKKFKFDKFLQFYAYSILEMPREKIGFNVSTEIKCPEQGKYEVTFEDNSIGYESNCTIWVELFVEKRIHPEIKPRINTINKSLERLQLTLSDYSVYEQNKLITSLSNENKILESNLNNSERQLVLSQLLKKRILHNKKCLKILNEIILEYKFTAHANHHEFSEIMKIYIPMLKQLANIIVGNTFATNFLYHCERYLTQKSINHENIVWGRKQTPDQQPLYKMIKTTGLKDSIKISFEADDKPDSIWRGNITKTNKTGYQPTFFTESAFQSIKEKIAMDLYEYLSDSNYIVPKTRLAELSIDHAGVYILSKTQKAYRCITNLQSCIIQNGKLPEDIIVDKKRIPLKGLIEILAVARLLADTNPFGKGATNVKFIIARDIKGEPIALRAVKINSGNAFNFSSKNNQFSQDIHQNATANNSSEHDRRNLMYSDAESSLLWSNLTNSQQKQFIKALDKGLEALSNTEKMQKMITREAFKKTPTHCELPPVDVELHHLKQNLKFQEVVYAEELIQLRNTIKFGFN